MARRCLLAWYICFCATLIVILVYIDRADATVSTLLTQATSFEQGNSRYNATQRLDTRDREFFEFVTRPDIGAPKWDITIFDKDALAPGYWFVAPYANLEQTTYPLWKGPHIYKGNGELVWSGAPMFDHLNTFDFRVVTVDGQEMLSLINPDNKHRAGVILDQTYNISSTVNLRGQLDRTNMHDFTVVENEKRALTLSIVKGKATLEQSRVVGFDGECKVGWEGFRELDVETSEVLFDWIAQGHVGLNECTKTPRSYEELCTHGWDILYVQGVLSTSNLIEPILTTADFASHLNSIDKFPDSDYLVSSRHTDTIYKISHVNGSIVWRLGGVKSDFNFAKDAKFSRQHHARVYSQNETQTLISLFDNAEGDGEGEHATHEFSRGLLLSLNSDTPRTAELLQHYDHPNHGITNSRGSLTFLPNGNAFMGWTYGSLLSEHSSNGSLLMKAHFKHGLAHTYRAYKFPWVGRPSQPPDVHSALNSNQEGMQMTVRVSWNGATDVANWKLYAASIEGIKQHMIASVPNQGFESVMKYNGYSQFVVAQAYDVNGDLLGSSEVTARVPEAGMTVPLADEGSFFLDPLTAFVLGVTIGVVCFCGILVIWAWRCDRLFKWKSFKWSRKSRGPEYAPLQEADESKKWVDE